MSNTVLVEEVKTMADFEYVKEFAKSINHEVSGKHRIKFISVNGIPVGYAEIVKQPLINTGWKYGNPKEVLLGMKQIKAWSEVEHGGCITLVDPTSGIAPHMERLGFVPAKQLIYHS